MADKYFLQWQNMNKYEDELSKSGANFIAGVDEAGRGPLAGQVAAAAVILPRNAYIPSLNDSKKLSEKRRLILEDEIKQQAIAWSCVMINPDIIDQINILEATKLAMIQAIHELTHPPQHVLTDAVILDIDIPQTNIIKGDALSVSIAAASIIAKNTRDRLMYEYDKLYPQYHFAKHKGYPTALHKEALRQYGPCPIHRKSFKY